MASLEVIQGPDKGRAFMLAQEEMLLGRQGDGVALTDSTVSRRHARLRNIDEEWVIEDVGSVNGTFVNGRKLDRPLTLRRGDQIRCGTTLLVFSAGGTPPPLDVDESGKIIEASIMATVPANEDSVIIPTLEAGAAAVDNLRILYDLTTEVSSIFNLDRLLQRTLDVIVDVIHPDRAFALLIGKGGELIPKAAGGAAVGAVNGQFPVSRTIINEVITRQMGVLSSNAMRDKRFSAGKSVHDYGIRSAICVPIKGRQKVIGVIHVDSSVAGQTYTTEQLRLLTALGYQTGLAIENVRLHEATVKSERLAAVGETVALLSHHIKNILQALGGGTEVVEAALGAGDVGRAKDAWPIVRRSFGRINALILNMLAFSKPRQPLLESINVNPVLAECAELLASEAEERSVGIITELSDSPPVPADAEGIHQAVLNLLTNALDAVRPGQGLISLTSRFDPLDQQVVVRVTDNGVGIAPQELEQIFEPFHSSKGQKGTGLGLAVTRKIIEEHRGRVTVESTPGAGTTFTVTLPIRRGGRGAGDTHAS